MSEQGPGGPGGQEPYVPRHATEKELARRFGPGSVPVPEAPRPAPPEQRYLGHRDAFGALPDHDNSEWVHEPLKKVAEGEHPKPERPGPPLGGEGRYDAFDYETKVEPGAQNVEAKQSRLAKARERLGRAASWAAGKVPGEKVAGAKDAWVSETSKQASEVRANWSAAGQDLRDEWQRGVEVAKVYGPAAKDAWAHETTQQAAEVRANWSQAGQNLKSDRELRREQRQEHRQARKEIKEQKREEKALRKQQARVEKLKPFEPTPELSTAEWNEVTTRLRDVYAHLEHPLSHSHDGAGDAATVRLGGEFKFEGLDKKAAQAHLDRMAEMFLAGLGMMDKPVVEFEQKNGDTIKRYGSSGLKVGEKWVGPRVAVEEIWVKKSGEHKILAIVADRDVFAPQPWRAFSKRRGAVDFSYVAERHSATGYHRNAFAPEGVKLGTVAPLPADYYTRATAKMAGVRGIMPETIPGRPVGQDGTHGTMPEMITSQLKIPRVPEPESAEARDQKFASVDSMLKQVMELKEATPVIDHAPGMLAKRIVKGSLRNRRERTIKRIDEIAAELGLVRSYDGTVEAVQSPDLHTQSQAYVDKRNKIWDEVQHPDKKKAA